MAVIRQFQNGKWVEQIVADEIENIVKTVPQELTDGEKEQARDNIGAAPATHTHTKSEITDFPTSMPASDVPAWAKSDTKPTYTADEVGAASIEDINNLIAESKGTLGKAWMQSEVYSPEFTSICSDGTAWVAGSRYDTKVYYSTDSKTWSSVELGDGEGGINCVYYANGYWVATGGGVVGICYSTDGINWEHSSVSIEMLDVYYSDGYWVAVGTNGNILYTNDITGSWDWGYIDSFDMMGIDAGTIGAVLCGGGYWVTISTEFPNSGSTHGAVSVAPVDEEDAIIFWGRQPGCLDTDETLKDLYYYNGLWVFAGPKSTGGLYYVANENVFDGTYHAATMDVPSGFNCVRQGNGLWIAGSIDNGIYYSADGMTWTQTNIKTGTFLSLHYANNLWMAGSTKGTYYSEDGITWSQGAGLSSAVNGVQFAGEDWVAATGKGLYYSVPFSDNSQGVYDMAKSYADSLVPSVVNSIDYEFEIANNVEYRMEGVSGLLMTGNNNKAHGFITFGGWIMDGIEVSGFKASSGDDITEAAAGETWEFSCDNGYIIWKNWGA